MKGNICERRGGGRGYAARKRDTVRYSSPPMWPVCQISGSFERFGSKNPKDPFLIARKEVVSLPIKFISSTNLSLPPCFSSSPHTTTRGTSTMSPFLSQERWRKFFFRRTELTDPEVMDKKGEVFPLSLFLYLSHPLHFCTRHFFPSTRGQETFTAARNNTFFLRPAPRAIEIFYMLLANFLAPFSSKKSRQ